MKWPDCCMVVMLYGQYLPDFIGMSVCSTKFSEHTKLWEMRNCLWPSFYICFLQCGWRIWLHWLKKGLEFWKNSALKQTSSFLRMSQYRKNKPGWGRKMFPNYDFINIFYFNEKSLKQEAVSQTQSAAGLSPIMQRFVLVKQLHLSTSCAGTISHIHGTRSVGRIHSAQLANNLTFWWEFSLS